MKPSYEAFGDSKFQRKYTFVCIFLIDGSFLTLPCLDFHSFLNVICHFSTLFCHLRWKDSSTCHCTPHTSKGSWVCPKTLCHWRKQPLSTTHRGTVALNLSQWWIRSVVQQYHSTEHLKRVTQFLPPFIKFPHPLRGQLSNRSTAACEWKGLNPWSSQNCVWAERLTRKLTTSEKVYYRTTEKKNYRSFNDSESQPGLLTTVDKSVKYYLIIMLNMHKTHPQRSPLWF